MTPTDHQLSGSYGDQLSLLGEIPVAGETYRNRHTADIVTVVSIDQRRHAWVVYRTWGHERRTDLGLFMANWQRCRPDGRLL